MKSNIFSGLVILISLFFYAFSVQADGNPEIFVQLGHSENVTALDFSPNGKYIASGSSDKSVRIWDVGTGREIRTLRLEQPVFGHNSVKFSPDGKLLASAEAEGFIRIWDVFTGQELKKFPVSISEKLEKDEFVTSSVIAIALSPDGKSLIVAAEIYFHKGEESYRKIKPVINFWDIKTEKLKKIIPVHAERISDMALLPDGKYVLLGCGENDNSIRLIDLTTGKEIRKYVGHSKAVHNVTVSPDGEYFVSGSEDRTIILWHIKNGKKIKTFTNKQRYERFSMAFSPEGRHLIVSGLSEIELWDIPIGRLSAKLKGDSINPWSTVFSPDGRHAAFSFSHAVGMWDTSTVIDDRSYHTSEVAAKLYGHTLAVLRTFGGNVGWISGAYFSMDTARINVLTSFLHEFDRSAGSLRSRKNINNSYKGGFFELERDYARGGMINVIDSKRGGKIIMTGYNYINYNEIPYFLTFSPDGRYAVAGEHKDERFFCKIIDIRNKREISTLETPPKFLMDAAVFSPDGRYMAGRNNLGDDHFFTLWDVSTGKVIRTFSGHSHFVYSIFFMADGRHILSGSADNTIKLWDTETGREIRTFKGHDSSIEAIDVSGDGKYMASGEWEGKIKLWEMDTGREIKTFKGHTNKVSSILFSSDNRFILSGSHDSTTRLWDISTGKEQVQFINFTDGEWIVITPEGYYNSSPNGDKHLNVRIGNNVYGIENYRESFFRPDIVKVALSGGSLKEFRKLADVKQPPTVNFVETPKNINKDETAVTLRLADNGGGIGDIRLFLNGSAVLLDSTRGVKITPKDDKAVYKTYTLKLTNGLNTIKAVAFNSDNTMQSNDATYEITASFKSLAKPSINALIVGINEYKNPKLELKYAVPDANLFESALKTGATGLFDKINVKKIISKEETTNENIIKELKIFQKLNPDDLFIFFVASHGTVDEGEYFLITSNVGSTRTEKLKTDALSQATLKELIANIPATKKLIIIDTCNAGALGDAIQVAMLTRGMSEDTAIKILSRAVGSTILSASTSVQEAMEGYNGHGLFTYVLTEGLKGKADKSKTGYIKTTELADYVDNEVPILAEKVFKRAQYPTISISGQGFPVGKVK